MSDVMVFRAGGKEYSGSSALEIVQALKREAAGATARAGRSGSFFSTRWSSSATASLCASST